MSPTIFRTGPYRVHFFSHDGLEPAHVHVDRDALSAKFWLNPVALAYNHGYSPKELRTVERIVTENQGKLLEAWNAFFRT